MAMDRLNVTKFNLQDLKTLAHDAGDKKIRMKTEGDEKILYVSNKKDSGFRNFFTGRSDKREAKARQFIEQELGFVQLQSPKTGLKGSSLHKTLDGCGTTINMPTKYALQDPLTTQPRSHDVPDTVTFNGKTYDWQQHIATKGFGHVHEYRSNDGEVIAVKILTNKPDMPTAEFHMHERAQGGGDNVIGVKGALVNPANGQVLIGMEMAVGDCETAMDRLNKMEQNGDISHEAANAVRMTMLHDMARGVEQVTGNGIIHYDAKPDNFLITPQGHAVICDFGTSETGDKNSSSGVSKMLSPKGVIANQESKYMKPPELTEQFTAKWEGYNKAKKELTTQLKNQFMDSYGIPHNTKFSEIDPPEMAARLRKEWQAIDESIIKNPKLTNVKIKSGTDSWGLGMTAFQMLKGTGQRPPQFIRDNDLDIEKAIVDYGADKSNRIFDNVQQPMERIVNGLLHPDEKKRTKTFDLLNDKTFFQTPGFGSPEVRELMKALSKNDVPKIQQYSNAIDNLDPNTDGDRRVKLYVERKGEVMGQALESTGLV